MTLIKDKDWKDYEKASTIAKDGYKKPIFFLTGSRVYGPYNSIFSDIDIIMFRQDAMELKEWCEANRFHLYLNEHQMDSGHLVGADGFYFNIHGIEINIIIVDSQDEYNSWEYATQEMIKRNEIKDKMERIEKFKQFFIEKYEEITKNKIENIKNEEPF